MATFTSRDTVSFLLAVLNDMGFNPVNAYRNTVAFEKHCYNQGSDEMLALVEGWMEDNLNDTALADIAARKEYRGMVNDYTDITRNDVSDLEIEQDLDRWISQDNSFQEKYDMYMNEY